MKDVRLPESEVEAKIARYLEEKESEKKADE
jgi:hypothetical protein